MADLNDLAKIVESLRGSSPKSRVKKPAASAPVAAAPAAQSPFAGVRATGSVDTSGDYATHNWATDIIDDLWTDDASFIPGATRLGEAVTPGMQGYAKAVNVMSQAAVFTETNIPGGVDGLTWEQSDKVSLGQAGMADASKRQTGNVFDLAIGAVFLPFQTFASGFTRVAAPDNVLNSPDFDLSNAEQRKAAFQDNALGVITSGATDAVASWYLDPGVVLGKGLKIARFGSEAVNVTGLTHRSTNSLKVADQIRDEVDTALAYFDSNGTVGARNAAAQVGEDIARMNADELMQQPWVKSSPIPDQVSGVFGAIKDARLATIAYAAATGDAKYAAMLRKEAASVSDAVERFGAVDLYEKEFLARPPRVVAPALLDDVLESNQSVQDILDDLIKRDNALADAVMMLDETASPITTIGSKSARYERLRQNMRMNNRATVQSPARDARKGIEEELDNATARGYLTGADDLVSTIKAGINDAAMGPKYVPTSGITSRVFQLSSGFRKVRVINWVGGERTSGWIDINTFNDGHGMREVDAFLNGSRSTRADKGFRANVRNMWAAASAGSTTDRLVAKEQMEGLAIQNIADAYRIDRDVLDAAMKLVKQKQAHTSHTLLARKGRAYAVDAETREVIFVHPQLQSQLENRVPLIDLSAVEKTAQRLAQPQYRSSWQNFRDEVMNLPTYVPGGKLPAFSENAAHLTVAIADELNSIWKAAVLLRLGYTQRNVLEGWLRSWAYLGRVPALAPVVMARGARNVYWNAGLTRKLTSVDAMQRSLADMVTTHGILIKQLDDELAAHADDGVEWAAGLRLQRAELLRDIEDYKAMSEMLTAKKSTLTKRYIGSDKGGAYSDPQGAIHRMNASNAQMVENFFLSAADRDYLRRVNANSWVKVTPDDPRYFGELANDVQQFRSDKIAQFALAGTDPLDAHAWINSSKAAVYAREMGLEGRAARDAHVDKIYAMTDSYFPTNAARKLAASDVAVTGPDFQALLGDLDGLTPIHGRELAEAFGDQTGRGVFRTFLSEAFKLLGSMPESALVRQPFYDAVWKEQYAALHAKALHQADGPLEDAALEAINRAAHRRALKATNDTLFTIARYSNPAAAMRFISPFFAAWENSIRTWGRMIINDPSIAARASILWNMPVNLGWVIDEDGNRVTDASPFSFLDGASNQFVVMPAPIAAVYSAAYGEVPRKVPRGSLNVVTPGTAWYLPGTGPGVTLPVGQVLASKPDVQQFLKDFLGEPLYQQIVPFDKAQSGLDGVINTVFPASARKLTYFIEGENSREYLSVLGAMTQSAIVDDRLGIEKFNAKTVKERVDSFFLFGAAASATQGFSTTRMSKYQLEIDDWRAISADASLTYAQKIDKFRTRHGDAYMALTRSTTGSQVDGLDPTLEAWSAMTDHADQVKMLAEKVNPEAVGVLAATVPDGEFNAGVYNYWLDQQMPGTDSTWKRKLPSSEILKNTLVGEMWASYTIAKTERDRRLAQVGAKSVTSNAAKYSGVAADWDAYKDAMAKKYGYIWTSFGPQSFTAQLPKTLDAVSMLLNDESFMKSDLGKSQAWQGLRTYMTARRSATDAIVNGTPSAYVKQQWDDWRETFRESSVKFADFYDQYLENDDLSKDVTYG